ncbi:hypothetical protein ACKUV4_018245 [Acinetobacter baumannii]
MAAVNRKWKNLLLPLLTARQIKNAAISAGYAEKLHPPQVLG